MSRRVVFSLALRVKLIITAALLIIGSVVPHVKDLRGLPIYIYIYRLYRSAGLGNVLRSPHE